LKAPKSLQRARQFVYMDDLNPTVNFWVFLVHEGLYRLADVGLCSDAGNIELEDEGYYGWIGESWL